VEKTTVSYAARELGISRQLVHIYIKKGLIRAERTDARKTAPLVVENADVKALLGSDKLKAAHAQRALLLGKKKTRRAATIGAVEGAAKGTAEAATLSGAATV
jgi:hypothetical protein